jgi:hypothetical protein
MAIFYLDIDDEITSAAARIRSSPDVDVALVLPAGSRIATSRINFRLLAREAGERSRRLAIVAPEASTRALAASAGLPVYASVVEYEDAIAPDEGPGEAAAAAGPAGAAPTAGEPTRDGTPSAAIAAAGVVGAAAARPGAGGARPAAHARPIVPPDAAGGGSAAGTGTPPAGTGSADVPDTAGGSAREGARARGAVGPSTGLGPRPVATSGRRRRWPLVVAALLVVAVLSGTGAAVGYVVLPAATVTLRLAATPVGPVTFTGTADPDAVAVDPQTATIPAVRVPVPLSATGTFTATGKRVEETAAKGTVQWQNCDPSRAYTIPARTIVRTAAGVGFVTQDAILLPVAIISGTPPNIRVECQVRSVGVTAINAGPAGNVAAGTIRVVPGTYDPQLVFVTNPAATSGGAREEFPRVTQKDVAAATATLGKQLDEQLAAVASNPPGTPPGATAYPDTARRGEAVPSVPPADLVGQEVATFDLTLTADGTVVAADPAPLEAIGAARVAAQVPDGKTLREGSVRVSVGEGTAQGELISYPVEARAEAVAEVSEDEVRTLVKGKTPAEAEALLADYGTTEIVLWPDWVTTITTLDARLSVTIEGVPPAEPAPTATPRPSPTPGAPPSTPPASSQSPTPTTPAP